MASGTQACGEGTFAKGNAVEGTITLASPPMKLDVEAVNP